LLVLALFVLIGDSAHAAQTKTAPAQTKAAQTKTKEEIELEANVKFRELCESGTVQQVEEAIKNGANINAKDMAGITPLVAASLYNPDIEVIVTLLENGAFINAEDNAGVTVLMYTVLHTDNLKIVDIFLKNGAKLDARMETGGTPLVFASRRPKRTKEILQILLDHGADVNQQIVPAEKRKSGYTGPEPATFWELGQTPLIMTAKYTEEPDSILFLLDRGADPHLRDKKDNRAIDYARKNKALAGTEALKRLEKVSRVKVIR
jgi:ankyrin repeat protein